MKIKSLILGILGGLCLLYSVMVRATGSGTGFFLVWVLLGLGFIGLAVLVQTGLWGKLPALIRYGFYGLTILGILVIAFGLSCIGKNFRDRGEENLDYLIVLGAQVYESGPSVVLRYRLDEAVRYLNENSDTVCIVTGGQGYNEPFPEAEGMKRYLVQNGIAEERIRMETESVNTVSNIKNSLVFLDPENDRVGIITNNFHLYRGIGLAKKQGIRNVCGIAARSNPVYLPNNLLREVLGILKDKLVGNM